MFGSTHGSHSSHSRVRESQHNDTAAAPLTSEEVLALYEGVSQLSRQMVDCARSQDWSMLAQLEQDCATRLIALKSGVTLLSGEMRKRKVRLLQDILADDRAIRMITEPGLETAAWFSAVHR